MKQKAYEIVVASGKGGVGKSTITASLLVLLSRHGYKLLGADADAEAPNLHISLGVADWDRVEPYYEGRVAYILDELCTQCGRCLEACQFGAVEIVNGRYRINPWICEGCYTCSFVCPVKAVRFNRGVVAGYLKVKERTRYGFPLVSSESMPGRPNSGKLVTETKNIAKKMLGSEGLIFIDAAAGIGCQVISSLVGASALLMVAEPTPTSLSDLKRLHTLARHFRIPSMLVINKADLDESYRLKLIEYAREWRIDYLGDIPYDEKVPQSLERMTPIVEASPDSLASKALFQLAERLREIIEDMDEWRIKHLPPRQEPFVPKVIKPEGR
ncbi:MAG: P-loop NTPase [Infirmifilum sp.]